MTGAYGFFSYSRNSSKSNTNNKLSPARLFVILVAGIDECASDAVSQCSVHADCRDKTPGFTCTCHKGYAGNGTFCEDIDECGTRFDTCPPSSTCRNTDASFECICDAGFKKDSNGECSGTQCPKKILRLPYVILSFLVQSSKSHSARSCRMFV